jgi:uncharacterized damage-inducible protein DinB
VIFIQAVIYARGRETQQAQPGRSRFYFIYDVPDSDVFWFSGARILETNQNYPARRVLKETLVFTVDGTRKFHSWTHACLKLVIDHLSTIPAGDYSREAPGFGFSTLCEQVIHIFNCEGLWIHALQGLTYRDRNPADCPSVADARLLQGEVGEQTLAYLSSLTDQQLNRNTELRFPDGDTEVRTPAFVLHHVLTHAFHHKGQIVAMCRVLGHPAPDTDLSQIE